MKRLSLFLFLALATVLFSFRTTAPLPIIPAEDGIHWISFEEALVRMKEEKRKIMVSVYTDYCGWCKHMDRTTFQEEQIVEYVNKTFYPVKLNAQQKEDIETEQKVYKFQKVDEKSAGYHELATALTMGRLTFPSTIFLDESVRILQPIPGYKDSNMFEMIMTYYGNNHFKRTPWTAYQNSYVPLEKIKATLISE